MVSKLVSSLALLVICVYLFGMTSFAYGQDSNDETNELNEGETSYGSNNDDIYEGETSYGNSDNNIVVDAEDPLPTLPYDGVQMTKDIADLKDLVANLKNQVIQNTGDLASTIVQIFKELNLRN